MPATLQKTEDKLRLYSAFIDINKCKAIPGGRWNKEEKCWEYPFGSITAIVQVFNNDIQYDKVTKTWKDMYFDKYKHIYKLKKGTIEPREHAFLMKHQRVCKDIATVFPRYGFFLDTGTGKTLTSLAIMEEHSEEKWLVLCPKSIIKTAWIEDQKDFFPDMKLLPIARGMSKADYMKIAVEWEVPDIGKITSKKLLDKLIAHADAYVTNPESFKPDIEIYKKAGVTSVIMDESSMLKNPAAQITKTFTAFSDGLNRVYLLSGKPAPNREDEYFPQVRIINPGVFGTSITRFKERYFTKTGYMGYELVLKPGAEEAIAKKLSECSIVYKKDDCLDLPEKTYIRRMVELPAQAAKYYRDMEKKQLLVLGDRSIDAPHKMTAIMKLRQITSGFIIDTENGTTDKLHNAKLNELSDVVDELGDNKAIIWINFKEEVREIAEMLEKKGKTFVTAYSGTKSVDDSVQAFKDNSAQFIIAHPKTLKYGVTFTGKSMVKNCTYAIYYSMSYSYEDYYQSHDRIYRKGQTEKCTYIFLMVENSVDTDISIAVDDKDKRTEVIENFLRRVE